MDSILYSGWNILDVDKLHLTTMPSMPLASPVGSNIKADCFSASAPFDDVSLMQLISTVSSSNLRMAVKDRRLMGARIEASSAVWAGDKFARIRIWGGERGGTYGSGFEGRCRWVQGAKVR